MRLNLGCGDRYADGWHNVDHAGCPHRKDEAVDVRGDLPWSGVTHAYCGHLLEHLYPGVALSFLARLRRRMAVDGQLMVVGPDVAHAQLLAGLGQLDVPLSSLTDGAGRAHHPTAPTLAAVRDALRDSLPAHALPRRLAVLDALPLRGPGKPDRAALRAILATTS